jgi:hypothetical protein
VTGVLEHDAGVLLEDEGRELREGFLDELGLVALEDSV